MKENVSPTSAAWTNARKPGLLLAGLAAAGFAAMSVHVGMLAAGAPFPLPQPPLWARWLNEAFIAGGLLIFLRLANPSLGHRGFIFRTLIACLVMAAIQETLRVAIMSGVVTGGWAYSAIGLIKPLIRVVIVALACTLAVRWVRGPFGLLGAALAVAAVSAAARKLLAYVIDPFLGQFAWLSRPDLYAFPYPFHVTFAAYLSFAEAVAGAFLLTLLVWSHLPQSRLLRLLAAGFLVALIKGVVGNTLLYSSFTGSSVVEGVLSWSQFLLEFFTLGCLVALAWDAFGGERELSPTARPTRAGSNGENMANREGP
ncbi:hypothetical protein [Sphingopyxis sp. JAI108]|uniref:hypothetical protein n=1 Tax=Sphingopyxis sp. JAI108 TaxID=2723060 RepID=UPI0015C6D16E|nr:hypothetical protein [Sphingopyxis sp. JAI108]NYF30612.1 hypothetical protein [Sphingopyxis sp. JAI108]